MTPMLEQFVSEGRDFLQGISEKLLQLEKTPQDAAHMGELFRLVHTLKGNCGLFDFPEMSRVLHAAEDLMVLVRDGDLAFSQTLADVLFEAMDFVNLLLDEIQTQGHNNASHAAESVTLAQALRSLIPAQATDAAAPPDAPTALARSQAAQALAQSLRDSLAQLPEAQRMALYRQAGAKPLLWLCYTPEAECFFKGEDPFFQVRQTPDILWQRVYSTTPAPALAELDAYQCTLCFELISNAPRAQIEEHYRYVSDQIALLEIVPLQLVLPVGDENGGPVYEDFVLAALTHLEQGNLAGLERAARSMLELSAPGLWLASALRWLLLLIAQEPRNMAAMHAVIESLRTFAAPVWPAQQPAQATHAVHPIISAQLAVLALPDQVQWLAGRLKAVATTLRGFYRSQGQQDCLPALEAALQRALEMQSAKPLLDWLTPAAAPPALAQPLPTPAATPPIVPAVQAVQAVPTVALELEATPPESDPEADHDASPDANPDANKAVRRHEEAPAASKTLKVEQEKIDRLMNLIGEMVVAKNALPYLASRAESVFGVRELAREIKSQYAVINRISEEMQDTIMQVRMLPVSFVFQRFPRLVRDISRKLGKEVQLVLEGENTEADKNIIEALADPLIHIVRNSLDHGLELPEVRRAAGKPEVGQLLIRASQEAGRVIIDITDDGRGIDPYVIKRKAFAKGLIDSAALESMSDQEAINLVFAAGFSTVDVVSDLSGRGVGMDVVRTALERVNGMVTLQSKVGEGTRLRLSLPLSIAVSSVMIVESGNQIFGVPMDMVVETVRIAHSAIYSIKSHQAAVLRGRIVPLRQLNDLLATNQPQRVNSDGELATLVVRIQGENIGIVVDEFREVAGIILKPLGGILGGQSGFTGSALLGDGAVLLVLNLKELV